MGFGASQTPTWKHSYYFTNKICWYGDLSTTSLPLTKRQCHSYVIQMSFGQMIFDQMMCNCIFHLTCLQPSCSITSGGNTLKANRYTETGSARRCTGLTYYPWALELAKHLPGDVHIILSTQCAGEVTFQPVYR